MLPPVGSQGKPRSHGQTTQPVINIPGVGSCTGRSLVVKTTLVEHEGEASCLKLCSFIKFEVQVIIHKNINFLSSFIVLSLTTQKG